MIIVIEEHYSKTHFVIQRKSKFWQINQLDRASSPAVKSKNISLCGEIMKLGTGFLDPENVGVGTGITFLSALVLKL